MPTTLLGMKADDPLDNIRHTYVDVANVSTPVVSRNGHRRWLLLINDSNEDIYVSIGVPAVLHQGILLTKNGGSFQFSLCATSLFWYDIYAVQNSTNTKRLLVTEGE